MTSELKAADGGLVTLLDTNVRYEHKKTGATNLVVIPLDSISSCAVSTQSSPLLLLLAGLFFLPCFSPEVLYELQVILGISGAVLIAAFFATKKAILRIASAGGDEIAVRTAGLKREAIVAFIELLIKAKRADRSA